MRKVLLVDDHPIVRQGCRRILSDIGIGEVDEAARAASGYRSFLHARHDCVVTDLTFAGDDLSGLGLVERIVRKAPSTRLLVFSMHDDPAIVSRCFGSGAHGYVLKDSPSTEFAAAMTRVLAGERHLSPELAIRVATLRSKGHHSSLSQLTERERQILRLLGLGDSYDMIATKLGISYKTVANVILVMRSKLNLPSLADLMRFAMRADKADAL